MEVTVETQCSRCLKKEEVRVSLEQAQEMEAVNKERETAQDSLKTNLANLLMEMHDLAPDFVLIQQVNKGDFRVRMLNELCDNPEAKRKGCKARVEVLMKEIFMENPRPVAQPKKKNNKKDKGSKKGAETSEGGEQ